MTGRTPLPKMWWVVYYLPIRATGRPAGLPDASPVERLCAHQIPEMHLPTRQVLESSENGTMPV